MTAALPGRNKVRNYIKIKALLGLEDKSKQNFKNSHKAKSNASIPALTVTKKLGVNVPGSIPGSVLVHCLVELFTLIQQITTQIKRLLMLQTHINFPRFLPISPDFLEQLSHLAPIY